MYFPNTHNITVHRVYGRYQLIIKLLLSPIRLEQSSRVGSVSPGDHQSDDGYHILFDGHDCQYYLATGGTVVGMHGTSLMKTIEGM